MPSSDVGQWISTINPALPAGSEKISDGDDAIRHTKKALQDTLPNLGGVVSFTHTKLNFLDNNTFTDAAQIIIGPNVKADNVANASLTINASDINFNTKRILNVSDTVPDGKAVGNRDYNDGRYYQQSEVDAAISAAIAQAIAQAKNECYPVGCLYESTSSTNPATALGFGTWSLYGLGRVTVCIDVSQGEFNAPGETGGSKTHTLTLAQLPPHTHTTQFNNQNGLDNDSFGNGAGYKSTGGFNTGSAGSGQPHNNLQPYIVVYRWRRTA